MFYNNSFYKNFRFHFQSDLDALPIIIEEDSKDNEPFGNTLDEIQTETIPAECNKSKGLKKPTVVPKSCQEKLSVPGLLGRLNDKKCRSLHTDGFDIPKGILKRLNGAKKKSSSWQENDQNQPNKPSNKPCSNQNNSKINDSPTASTGATIDSVPTMATTVTRSSKTIGESVIGKTNIRSIRAKVNNSRSNLLKIPFSERCTDSVSDCNKSDLDQPPMKKRKESVSEHSKSELDPDSQTLRNVAPTESHVEIERFHVPWTARNSYTERLYTFFTLVKSRNNAHQSDLDGSSSNPVKTTSSKYKCKICEENGTESAWRVSGIVTCLHGNNSGMKRHIETVSFMKFIFSIFWFTLNEIENQHFIICILATYENRCIQISTRKFWLNNKQ